MGASKGSVLVVDDDVDIRFVLSDVLESEGYRPVPAENGQEALDLLQRMSNPGLVLLDLMMPVMDGHEFLRQVRARPELCSRLRVVVCTASVTLPSREPPVQGVLQKPLDLDELLGVLNTQTCT